MSILEFDSGHLIFDQSFDPSQIDPLSFFFFELKVLNLRSLLELHLRNVVVIIVVSTFVELHFFASVFPEFFFFKDAFGMRKSRHVWIEGALLDLILDQFLPN